MASEMRTIKLGDQDWKVTPFHCVVGDIVPISDRSIGYVDLSYWTALTSAWEAQLPLTWCGLREPLQYSWWVYPPEWKDEVARWRLPDQYRPVGCWTLNHTNNPLIVNEYKLEEITLACIDDGKLIVTNFADLPGAGDAIQVYQPGEFWVSYCEGGAEKALREGRARKE